MKEGEFFQIPECPADIDRLRRNSTPLDATTCPPWLDPVDCDSYRHCGWRTCENLGADAEARFAAEIDKLHETGLIVTPDRAHPDRWHVYIAKDANNETWSIGVYAGRSPFALTPAIQASQPVLTRDDVTDNPAVFVADPFVVQRGGQWFMFFEVLNWRANKGEIALATSADGLHWTYQQRVLVEPFHLSYPYVMEVAGDYFLIPETSQCGAVRLYQATEFPTEWVHVADLITQPPLVDATVFPHDDAWWMFAGCDGSDRHDTLRLFRAERLIGRWREHPASPVIQGDARGARPAGKMITFDGRLYRVGQNCHPRYGLDVRAFEIETLNARHYRETPVEPSPVLKATGEGWNAGGMHHLDARQMADQTWLAFVDGWTTDDWVPLNEHSETGPCG